MSFGLDAMIGLNFELHRTKNRFWNKVRYAIEGIKSLFLFGKRRPTRVRETLSTFSK
jgi:hypothetical protein